MIAPHIYSTLRYLSVIFYNYILYTIPKLADADPVGNLDSCSGTQNEKKNT